MQFKCGRPRGGAFLKLMKNDPLALTWYVLIASYLIPSSGLCADSCSPEACAHAFVIPRTSDIGDILDAAPAAVTRTLNSLHDLLVFHDGRQLMARPSNRALRELETMDFKTGWHPLLSPGVGRPL